MSPTSGSAIRVTVVTPLRNALEYLPRTVPTVLAAARNTGGVELIYVDNASTDGSYEHLSKIPGIRVFRREKGSIAAMRNFGASQASGDYLAFLDADCAIGASYFNDALDVMQTTDADATGFEVQLPQNPGWIEATWHNLHAGGFDREVQWINSANFFISREAFEKIGGFREDLLTGEDTEIGQRLIREGRRLWASQRLGIIHFGNPKSLRAFYRQKLWHGLGMFGTVDRKGVDKPTAMMIVHGLVTVAGIVLLFTDWSTMPVRLLLAVGLQVFAPSLTVAYRLLIARRWVNVPRALLLYWIYYWARLRALYLVLTGRADKFEK